MHDVEAKNHPTRCGSLDIPLMPWSFASIHILKMLIIFAGLFHGHLPSYRQVKTSIALCSAIFERKGKNDGYFRQLWLISVCVCVCVRASE